MFRELLTEKLVTAIAELLLSWRFSSTISPSRFTTHHRIGRRPSRRDACVHLQQALFPGFAHTDVADRRSYKAPLGAVQRVSA